MTSLSRPARRLSSCALVVVSSLGWGCTGSSTSGAARRSSEDLGAWTTTPLPAPPPTASAKPLGRWAFADTWGSLAVLGPRAPSKHLAEPVDAELRGDAPIETLDAGAPANLRPGAVRVEVLRRPGSDAVVAFFAMTKREPGFDAPGDDWEYAVAGPDGQLQALGRLLTCARCHAESPHDHRFGR